MHSKYSIDHTQLRSLLSVFWKATYLAGAWVKKLGMDIHTQPHRTLQKNPMRNTKFYIFYISLHLCKCMVSKHLPTMSTFKCSMSAGTPTYCIECSVKPASLWRRKLWIISVTTINSNTEMVYSPFKFQFFNLQKLMIRPVSFNGVQSFILYWIGCWWDWWQWGTGPV